MKMKRRDLARCSGNRNDVCYERLAIRVRGWIGFSEDDEKKMGGEAAICFPIALRRTRSTCAHSGFDAQ